MRGIAALLVLWCHLKYNLGSGFKSVASHPLLATDFGGIGVDIFFVISGFVITMTAAKLDGRWREFLTLRISRVVPLYFTISTYCLIEAALSSLLNGKLMRVSGRAIFNTYAFLPVLDGPNFTSPALVSGWTLEFEMWFYLCLAGLLILGVRRRVWLWLPGFLIAGLVFNLAFTQHGRWFLPKFLFHPITLEFCAGGVLYHIRHYLGEGTLCLTVIFSLVLVVPAWHHSTLGCCWTIMNDAGAGLLRATLWGSFAVCLVGTVIHIDLIYAARWPRLLLLLGDASYSIYLMPSALMLTVEIGFKLLSRLIGHSIALPPEWHGLLYVAGSTLFGVACWKYFEVPTTRFTKKYLFRLLKLSPATPTTTV